jgi:hypothetical protein
VYYTLKSKKAPTEITFTCLIIAGMQSCLLRHNIGGSISWDSTPYSPLKVSRLFGALPLNFFVVVPCLAYSWTINTVPPKRWLTFNRLHGIISQIIKLYTSSSVTISNRTQILFLVSIFYVFTSIIAVVLQTDIFLCDAHHFYVGKKMNISCLSKT